MLRTIVATLATLSAVGGALVEEAATGEGRVRLKKYQAAKRTDCAC